MISNLYYLTRTCYPIAVLAVLFFMLFSSTVVAQTERWVTAGSTATPPGSGCDNPGYSSIQAAIDDASAGDTINVCPGIYNERLFIDKSISIIGDPGNTQPGPGTLAPLLDGENNEGGNAIVLAPGVSGVSISGFEISGFLGDELAGNAIIGSGEIPITDISIKNNHMHNLGHSAVMVWSDGTGGAIHSNWEVSGNIIEGGFFTAIEFTNMVDSEIRNNIINGQTFGVHVQAWADEDDVEVTNIQIEDNLFTGNEESVRLFVWRSNVSVLDGISIIGNTIQESVIGIKALNLQVTPFNQQDIIRNVNIQINDILDNTGSGIIISGPHESININLNNIVGNDVGVLNESDISVNASCNWWGAPNGPTGDGIGNGDPIFGNIEFKPVLFSEAPDGVCDDIGRCSLSAGNTHGTSSVINLLLPVLLLIILIPVFKRIRTLNTNI